MQSINLIVVFFVYGLAFFTLGTVILIYPKKDSQFRLAKNLNMIGFFGVSHGLNEWVDMFRLILPVEIETMEIVHLIILPVSFSFLLLFGVRAVTEEKGKYLALKTAPIILLIAWGTITAFNSRKLLMGDILARYLIGVPGIVITCYALLLYMQQIKDQAPTGTARLMKITIVIFMAYGFFAGLIVPEAQFFPASIFNYTVFFNATGVPVQLFRTLCAIVLCYSFTQILKIFEWETLTSLRENRDNLEERVRERTTALQEVNKQLLCSVDERTRAEGTLRDVTSSLAEGIYVMDQEGKVIFMNPEAEHLLEWTMLELSDKNVHDTVHFRKADGSPLPFEQCGMFKVIKNGIRFVSSDEVFVRKYGTVFPISVICSPVIENGRVVASVTAFRDITEQKKMEKDRENLICDLEIANKELEMEIAERINAEEYLRQSEERFRFAMLGATDGLWDRNLQTDEIYYSPRWKAMLGYADEELANHLDTWKRLLHPEDRESTLALVRDFLEGHADKYEAEFRLRHKDGHYLDILSRGSLIRGINGEALRFVGTHVDITERKQDQKQIRALNEQLKHQVAKLDAANKELEAFSYSVSHDLRAPLRHMSGFMKLLQKRLGDYPDVETRDYMASIIEASKKMDLLIDDLLAFSRIARAETRRNKVSFNTLVKAAIGDIRSETKARDIIWDIDELPEVYGDQLLLSLVFANLISNAVKYTSTRPRAKIKIGYKEDKEEFIFFVKDNGVGFDMKYTDRLFGVFQRLHTQNEFEGNGIGLANVQRIISRHGGRVWADGAVGHGATFYFSIPKIKET
jgi:PAS domain S-box-containing protein